MKSKAILSLVVVSLALSFSYSSAEVPRMINYQGKITTPQGALIDTTISMVFTIYDDSAGGSALWTETQTSVAAEKGIFSVLLGSVNPIWDTVFTGDLRYLGIKVGDDPEMTPRKAIVSMAYAFRSLDADTAAYARGGPGVADNDWDLRITDAADTSLVTGGLWGIARYGTILLGSADSTHVNLGVACTTGVSGSNHKYCTVAGGKENAASREGATVAGGGNNTASEEYTTVGGGLSNTVTGWRATIGGGFTNNASGTHSTIGGGDSNIASGNRATVGGGVINIASGSRAVVGGGFSNAATGGFATIGGGWDQEATGTYSAVGGGRYNSASGEISTVAGGFADSVAGDYSFACGSLVRLTSTADYTFAFGNDFTTSASNAIIFYDAISESKVGIQTTDPTARLDVHGSTGYNQIRMRTSYTPTGTGDANGNVGDVAWDDDYFYVKTNAGWKRAALDTW